MGGKSCRAEWGSFPGLGFASLSHISQQEVLTHGLCSLQAGDSGDMSRELQDVDLAEVKPLVEKGEVSGDTPGYLPSHAHSSMGVVGV